MKQIVQKTGMRGKEDKVCVTAVVIYLFSLLKGKYFFSISGPFLDIFLKHIASGSIHKL